MGLLGMEEKGKMVNLVAEEDGDEKEVYGRRGVVGFYLTPHRSTLIREKQRELMGIYK